MQSKKIKEERQEIVNLRIMNAFSDPWKELRSQKMMQKLWLNKRFIMHQKLLFQ